MNQFMQSIDGKKTYIALAIGAMVIAANHFVGPISGVNLDPANWMNDEYTLILGAAFRSAVAKTSAAK